MGLYLAFDSVLDPYLGGRPRLGRCSRSIIVARATVASLGATDIGGIEALRRLTSLVVTLRAPSRVGVARASLVVTLSMKSLQRVRQCGV